MRLPPEVQKAIDTAVQSSLDTHNNEWITASQMAAVVGCNIQTAEGSLARLAHDGACLVMVVESVAKESRIRRRYAYRSHPVETGRVLAEMFGMVAVQPVGGRIVRGRSFIDDDSDWSQSRAGRLPKQHEQHA